MIHAGARASNSDAWFAAWLPALPTATYVLSYFCLALYHGRICLWNTVIHESGQLTLGESILYASHFLGHLPSLTVVAIVFCGSLDLLLSDQIRLPNSLGRYVSMLLIFLGISAWISVAGFGWEQTWEYLLQQRQGEHRLEAGGSWLLHLPTTTLLLTGLPVYVAVMIRLAGRNISIRKSALGWFVSAVATTIVLTYICCDHVFSAVSLAWSDARYLAHSVRELATYPLTFFPLPLYFVLRTLKNRSAATSQWSRAWLLVGGLGVVAGAGLVWQVWGSLSAGIGELAQRPAFAKGGELSVAYLLASHYFEHVLDTIYFTLLCLLLLSGRGGNNRKVRSE